MVNSYYLLQQVLQSVVSVGSFVHVFVISSLTCGWAEYLENDCRSRLGTNGPPIGNGIWRIDTVT